MFRNLLLASVIALGSTGAALAQEGPRLVGGGGNGGPEVVYDNNIPGNVLGGAQVRMSGATATAASSMARSMPFRARSAGWSAAAPRPMWSTSRCSTPMVSPASRPARRAAEPRGFA